MKKFLTFLLGLSMVLLPGTALATSAVPWSITNLTDTFIFPNLVNGSAKGILVSATSSFLGSVGIGTTSPNHKLTIVGADSNTSLITTAIVETNLVNTDQTVGNSSQMAFDTADSAGVVVTGAKIVGVFTSHVAGAVAADLVFLTRTAGVQSEKARITSAGLFGVGTTTPWRLLSVGTNNTGTFAISTSTAGCAQFSALGELYSTGTTCGTGGGGGVTSVTGTYPIISSGGTTPAISTAFGTTSSNTFAGTQTFTNSPVISTLGAGTVNSTSGGTVYNTATSTPTVSAPITYSGTLGQFISGVSGAFGCTTASAGVTGCLSGTDYNTFAAKENALTFTWPLIRSTNTITFGGLSTSTAAVQGNLPYFSGVNTFANVATTSVTCTGNATCTAFTAIGASPITINVSAGTAASSTLLGDTNTFSGTGNNFTNVLKLTGLLDTASSTISGALGFPALTQGFAYIGSGAILQSAASSSLFGYTPLNPTRQLTVAGTANQITSSAGAQDLSADRTWTLSLPSLVVFPNAASTTLLSSSYASSTNYFGANLATCTGTSAITWSAGFFGCTAIPQGTVTSVTATNPLFSSGGATPNITTIFSTSTTWGIGSGFVVAGPTGIPFTAASSSLSLPNAALQNSSVTVNTTAPLGGGGSVSLGGAALTLTCASCVTSAVTSIGNGLATSTGPSIGFATSSVSFNGLTVADAITNSGTTFTITPLWSGTLNNAGLTNSSVTVNTGTGLSGGGSVSLGGTALSLANTGVISNSCSSGISCSGTNPSAFTNTGVTSIVAGTNVTISGATGAVTINSTAGGSSFAFPWTPTNNFGVNTNATSTTISLFAGLNASSTSHIASTTFDVTGFVGIGTSTNAYGTSKFATVISNAVASLGGLLINTATNVTNAFSIINAAGATVFNVDTTATNPFLGIGTTTPWATLSVVGNGTSPLLAVATTSNNGLPNFEVDVNGHEVFSGNAPVCTTNCTFVAGNDNAFRITTGAGVTTMTVTFAKSWGTSAPICQATEGSNSTQVVSASTTPTTVILNSATITTKDVDVLCRGLQ